jgi:hypothetical protein
MRERSLGPTTTHGLVRGMDRRTITTAQVEAGGASRGI